MVCYAVAQNRYSFAKSKSSPPLKLSPYLENFVERLFLFFSLSFFVHFRSGRINREIRRRINRGLAGARWRETAIH